jgi:hypothetical protein
MEMVAHETKSQDIHAIQDLQALDEIQQVGIVQIVNGKTGQGGSGNDMIHGALGISDKAGYAGHGIPPGDSWLVVMNQISLGWSQSQESVCPLSLFFCK